MAVDVKKVGSIFNDIISGLKVKNLKNEEQCCGYYLLYRCAKCGDEYGRKPYKCHGSCQSSDFIEIKPKYQSLM